VWNKQRQTITREELLNAKPFFISEAQVQKLDSGGCLVSYRKSVSSWERLLKFMVPSSELRQVMLDDLGARVAQQIDGNHTVQEIIDGLAAELRLCNEEIERALFRFLAMLGQRKIVALELQKTLED